MPIYKGVKTREISFPLGGIGTGSIGLAGNGRLIDWEIFNRPNKGSVNGFTHFAVKAEAGGKVLDARVLHGDLQPPYTGVFTPSSLTFGFGPPREYLTGLPHFRDVVFHGEYPVARLVFRDERFPGEVEMLAFNPFIPLNDRDSSIPAAFFEIRIRNTSDKTLSYTICLSAMNPLPRGTTVNVFEEKEGIRLIRLRSEGLSWDDPMFGELAVATDAADVSYQEYWYRGGWFDKLIVFWRDFTSPGRLVNRRYDTPGYRDHCSLAVHLEIGAGETGSARFIIAWNFPNCYNYWRPEEKPRTWKNYYSTLFRDSVEAALYGLGNWDRLYRDTEEFREALFSSTLPPQVLDAVSANLSILKSPTVLRLEDGSLYGFEGCHVSAGCCEGCCMHVWNYAAALAFMFPGLERSMLDLYFKYCQREDGMLSFRLQLPLGRGIWGFPHAAVDGQFGCVLRAYRYWKLSGDSQWLETVWESIRKAIEYAWAETNPDKWDVDRDGVIEGRQHNTLDVELFGPNAWLTGFYLAALKAGAEMAEFLGDLDRAREYRRLFEKGRRWVDENLFNGEYYFQKIDLGDRAVLERYADQDPRVVETYWDEEHGEIKYQMGEGCAIDQVLAQWHANLCGLGEIYDPAHVRKSLESIYRYNFKRSVRDFFNPCRIYSLNDEAGAVICEWPKGKYKPVIPVPYAEETWPGCEYAAASLMIQEGFVKEGLEIVKAVRDRFDGEKRNPWNEFECGSNYARSMSSYALLPALSGFEYDMVSGLIGFNPRLSVENGFKCFWSTGTGWGVFEAKPDNAVIRVKYGSLRIRTLRLPFLRGQRVKKVSVNGSEKRFESRDGEITLEGPILLERGGEIKVEAE